MTRSLSLMIFISLMVGACASIARETPPSLPAESRWQQHASMPTQRSEMPAVALDGLIYVPGGFGGEAAFEAYDPLTDTWQSLPLLPDGRHHLMAAAHGGGVTAGRIYIFGGASSLIDWRASDTAWAYDPASQEWHELARMPEPRLAGAAVSLGDYLYVVGGAGGSNALLRYDPAGDTWTTLAALAQAREHTAAVAMDGLIYALAGRWSGSGELASVEVYDPASDQWTAGPAMSVARGGHAAAVVNGQIVVAGGEVLSSGRQTLDSVEVLDPAQDVWSSGPALPVPLHGVPAVGLDGSLFILGGSDRAGAIENRGRVFSIDL
ncbi:MAG TPA: kelch repeat-containing protein [Anaerolineales bacterium]|nr:kelch repeat-containing protein [Anaerolineales bacterium]